jgi:AraC-like DNA-binding protein
MIYNIYIPSYPLANYIENIFYYKDNLPNVTLERYLPDGNITLIIDLTEQPKSIFDNESLLEIQTCKKAWFSGIRTKPITIPSGNNSEMLIVNFKKGMAFPFVNIPLYNLINTVIDAELVFGKDLLDIREKIIETKNIELKLNLMEQYLSNRIKNSKLVNSCVSFAINNIISSPHDNKISKISSHISYTQKHFINLFKDAVGLVPKDFLKVMRFQRAVEEINNQKILNWSEIALSSGYYDHSHFIAEFKLYSGFTPKQYISKQSNYLNYIIID